MSLQLAPLPPSHHLDMLGHFLGPRMAWAPSWQLFPRDEGFSGRTAAGLGGQFWTILDRALHNVLIQGSVVVIRQFLIFINQTFLMVSVALVTMVD